MAAQTKYYRSHSTLRQGLPNQATVLLRVGQVDAFPRRRSAPGVCIISCGSEGIRNLLQAQGARG